MLPKKQRLAKASEIREVVKRGFPVRTPTVLAHVLIKSSDSASGLTEIRFGYIAGKRIGNAVTRNYAKRRFREFTKVLMPDAEAPGFRPTPTENDEVGTPEKSVLSIVWRLNPVSATASSDEIIRDINRVWLKAVSASNKGKRG